MIDGLRWLKVLSHCARRRASTRVDASRRASTRVNARSENAA